AARRLAGTVVSAVQRAAELDLAGASRVPRAPWVGRVILAAAGGQHRQRGDRKNFIHARPLWASVAARMPIGTECDWGHCPAARLERMAATDAAGAQHWSGFAQHWNVTRPCCNRSPAVDCPFCLNRLAVR